MLSYQHEYHAGNHADVLKHSVLVLAIRRLQAKQAAIRVFDAFAGSGVYSLTSDEARRNSEFVTGIAAVMGAPPPQVAAIQPYLEAVGRVTRLTRLREYPGSSELARRLLRPHDQLVLLELHPRALAALRHRYRGDPQVHVHERDAFEGLPALLPPPERRGLALIDPSYEVKTDFKRVVELVQESVGRFATGCYVVWYPLIRDIEASRFTARMADSGVRKILLAELSVRTPADPGMWGSGVLIVNPPFGLEAELTELLPWLASQLGQQGAGRSQLRWLVPE